VICPHCSNAIHFATTGGFRLSRLDDPEWPGLGAVLYDFDGGACPSCSQILVVLTRFETGTTDEYEVWHQELDGPTLIYPRETRAKPLPPTVPAAYRKDYQEASDVLPISPNASAALSRRCLQRVLHVHYGIKRATLWEEVSELVASGELPSYLSRTIDSIRAVGNFAAHPQKDSHTKEIHEVEPGEAEWLLDLLESLLDHCFAKPAHHAKMRESLDAKLATVERPPRTRRKGGQDA
jgi:hypothetical protein